MIPLHASLLKLKELLSFPEDNYVDIISDYFSRKFDKNNTILTYDGRNAIHLALETIGLKGRDEVLIPGYICGTVKEAIGTICRPVYVDIDQRTFNIDSRKIDRNITENTKAILVAHLYGNPCDMNEIVDIARDRDLIIIEDIAQALNGKYNNKNLGSFGDLTVLSFRFTKDITSLRGGALLTDEDINIRLKPISPLESFSQLSVILASMNGLRIVPKSIYSPIKKNILFPVFNKSSSEFKISTKTLSNYQCYLLYKQLERLESAIDIRRKNARYYSKQLKDLVLVPKETKYGEHTYYRYTIQSNKRDALHDYLLYNGIEADKMYNYYLSPLVSSVAASKNNLNLPVHHKMTKGAINKVVEAIHEFEKLGQNC